MPNREEDQGFSELPGSNITNNYVWDSLSSSWIPMQQPWTGGVPPALAAVSIYDSAGNILTSMGGALNVNIATSVLPVGAATELTLSSIDSKIVACDTGNLDVALSTVATEATLSGLNSKIIACDTGNLDVALSTVATEATLSGLSSKIIACDTGNLDVALSTVATEATLSGLSSKIIACDTGNLDVALSTVATEATLSLISGNLDVALSTVATEATLSTLNSKITACDTGNLDAPLSTLATELTLSSIDGKIIACDTGNLDVALSTVATEATLSGLNSKITACDTGNIAGTVNAKLQDGSGNLITSTGNALDINIKSGSWLGTTLLADGMAYNIAYTGTLCMGQDDSSTYQSISVDSSGKQHVICYGNGSDALRTNYVGKLEVLLNSAITGQGLHTTVIGTDTVLDVNVAQSVLPTGAATEVTLSGLNSKIITCDTGNIMGAVTANAGTNLNTSALALESGGNLADIKANTDKLDVNLSTVAKESGGNLAILAAKDFATETTLSAINSKITACNTGAIVGTVTANAGTNLNTSALALESGGNLAAIKFNTDPLLVSSGGAYIRQDNTYTIARESGGNLAILASKDFATETTLSALNSKVTVCNTGNVSGTVFAKVQDGAGTNITSTLVGIKQGLDVNVISQGSVYQITRSLTGASPIRYLLLDASADGVTGYKLHSISFMCTADDRTIEIGYYNGTNYQILFEVVARRNSYYSIAFQTPITASDTYAPHARASALASPVAGIGTGDIWVYSSQAAGNITGLNISYSTF